MSKEFIVKVEYDINNYVKTSIVKEQLTRCRDCEYAEQADSTGYIKNCCIWNRVVPLDGFCYLAYERREKK